MPDPPTGSGRDLPAAYRSPWLALADDLLAVAASLGLAWRRLWRRNRQGDLPLPPFWPRSLAALFWPLLLALPLALAALLWLRPARLAAPVPLAAPLAAPGLRPDDAGPASAVAPATPAEVASAAAPASAGQASAVAAGPTSAVAAGSPSTPDSAGVSAPVSASGPAAATALAPAAPAGEPAAATAPAAPLDPLLQAFAAADPDRWIRAATALPQRQQLSLRLAARFLELPVAERRQRAESWYHQAVELGYEHLVLRDGLDRLLGRDALVGSGMILLDDGFPS